MKIAQPSVKIVGVLMALVVAGANALGDMGYLFQQDVDYVYKLEYGSSDETRTSCELVLRCTNVVYMSDGINRRTPQGSKMPIWLQNRELTLEIHFGSFKAWKMGKPIEDTNWNVCAATMDGFRFRTVIDEYGVVRSINLGSAVEELQRRTSAKQAGTAVETFWPMIVCLWKCVLPAMPRPDDSRRRVVDQRDWTCISNKQLEARFYHEQDKTRWIIADGDSVTSGSGERLQPRTTILWQRCSESNQLRAYGSDGDVTLEKRSEIRFNKEQKVVVWAEIVTRNLILEANGKKTDLDIFLRAELVRTGEVLQQNDMIRHLTP